ncbi:4-hydroxybenzoate octaprenyltransferase [Candidatus Pelagibacter sp.]|nr:4-hydroxybenzoate octaprenyltransferase [Candidatus Pelagibacter sp.]MDA9710438.1 4-hydroxybenzoate octaprenyltransferase [Candidatus Pelagibacter sp.]
MNQLYLFIELTRLKKPIGFMLLFWPCAWGLTIAYNFNGEIVLYLYYLLLFFLGAVLMRSAGCIVNDIADKNFDNRVKRTKDRPIASGRISIFLSYLYSGILCLTALIVLIQFNKLTILLALVSMPLAFLYPLMKRFTYWPQLFLGITFNYGLILGWTSINDQIDLIPLIFYFGAIFWTLGYDTIYGYQDIKDDEIIGLKSTSIKFKDNPIKFITLCYSTFLISLLIVGIYLNLNNFFYFVFIIILLQMTFFQLKKIEIKNSNKCLEIFKSNNYLGFLVLISLIVGKI